MLLFSRQSHFYRLWGLGRRLKQWNIYSSLIILPNSLPCLLCSFPYHVAQLEPGASQFCCSFICSSILHWLYAIYKYVTSMCYYSCLRKVFFQTDLLSSVPIFPTIIWFRSESATLLLQCPFQQALSVKALVDAPVLGIYCLASIDSKGHPL